MTREWYGTRCRKSSATETVATLTSYLGESEDDLQFFGIVPDNLMENHLFRICQQLDRKNLTSLSSKPSLRHLHSLPQNPRRNRSKTKSCAFRKKDPLYVISISPVLPTADLSRKTVPASRVLDNSGLGLGDQTSNCGAICIQSVYIQTLHSSTVCFQGICPTIPAGASV